MILAKIAIALAIATIEKETWAMSQPTERLDRDLFIKNALAMAAIAMNKTANKMSMWLRPYMLLFAFICF